MNNIDWAQVPLDVRQYVAELQRKYGNLASENDALKRQVQGLKGDLAAVGDRNKRLHAEREQALSEVQHVKHHCVTQKRLFNESEDELWEQRKEADRRVEAVCRAADKVAESVQSSDCILIPGLDAALDELKAVAEKAKK